jgi:transcriptional regulator with XRE-family HTH domain
MTVRPTRGPAKDLKDQLLEAVSHRVRSWNVAQSEAARRLGTDRVALNRMLQGRRTPSLEALLSFAHAADMTFHLMLDDGTSGAMVHEKKFPGNDRDVRKLSK